MERPILFNAEMVRALLDGKKTQTRRLVASHGRWACDIVQEWDINDKSYGPYYQDKYGDSHLSINLCPYGKPGDELWVRETHLKLPDDRPLRSDDIMYRDDPDYNICYPKKDSKIPLGWKVVPSIHMRKEDSRIKLRVKSVRVERVQDINRGDAEREGINTSWDGQHWWYKNYAGGYPSNFKMNPVKSFQTLWDSINAKRGYGWAENPWVWVVEFEVIN